MLEDIVIHQLDIRRPLERHRAIPNKRMIAVAADLSTNRFFPGPKLLQGIRATATDADWSAGDGVDVTGPIEALVLTLAGRFAALDQLQGDGSVTLRTRAAALRGRSEGLISRRPAGRLVGSTRYFSEL